jgi:PAS domain S-box-containing protein/putative nucleotidyltransferase with HDIG domain
MDNQDGQGSDPENGAARSPDARDDDAGSFDPDRPGNSFALIAELSSDGISLIRDDKFIYVNPSLAGMLGYAREELIGQPPWSVIPPAHRPPVVDRYRRRLAGETIPARTETALLTKTGETITADLHAYLIPSEGAPTHLAVLRDLTTIASLRKLLGGILHAFNMTVEMRDPYTAGHQKRVADLARAIGTAMGLSRENVEAIRTSATIHDLGKIAIPGEILSRPGRLNETEFRLVKKHPQTGYEILRSIEFPWEVADVVYQHHERLDGSGYPRGLKGGSICLEARILACADVVEAMMSHRPYRAALSWSEARREIEGRKGVLYDARVVDACVGLFEDDKFAFKPEREIKGVAAD